MFIKKIIFWGKCCYKFLVQKKIDFYIKKYSLKHERKIFTHLTDEEKIALHLLVMKFLPNNSFALEIGSYLGASSCFISNALSHKNGKLLCVDTWMNHAMGDEVERDTLNEFCKNTEKYVHVIKKFKGFSNIVIGDIKALNIKIDFLFIDGDHSYQACKEDWSNYESLLKDNAIIVLHDTGWADGVNRVIREFILERYKPILILPNMKAFRLK